MVYLHADQTNCSIKHAKHGDARESADGDDNNKQNDIDDDSRGATNLLQGVFDLGVQTLKSA